MPMYRYHSIHVSRHVHFVVWMQTCLNIFLFRNKSQKTKFDEELHDKMTTTINDLSSSKLVSIHIGTNVLNIDGVQSSLVKAALTI